MVDAHGRELSAFAWRLTGNRQDADDLVQEAYVRATRHLASLDGSKGAPRAWLFTVARCVAVDRWRRRSRRMEVPAEGQVGWARPEPCDQSDQVLDNVLLTTAMARLSWEHRQVLLHTVWLDYSVSETAGALGIPAGTVKSRCYYALRTLRLLLEQVGCDH